MIKFTATSICVLIMFLSCNTNKAQKQEKSWQVYRSIADSILNIGSSRNLKLFVEDKNERFTQVSSLNEWDRPYTSIIKVINSSEVKIYIEIPFSESGDWNNEYKYIFNTKGELKLLIRRSSFFNSGCTDGILTEVEVFTIESDQLVKKEHDIRDQNSKVIEDTTNCIFNYRFNYPVYLDYYGLPLIKQFKGLIGE